MKTYLLAAAAIAAISSPAAARDGSPYVALEGGAMFAQDTDVDLVFDDGDLGDIFRIDYKTGIDLDLLAGYDFGMVRAEAELGWKRAGVDSVVVDGEEFDDLDDDHVSVLSGMGNLLFDVGGSDRFSFYGGGGFGRARVKFGGESDSAWAWQIIAGARMAVSDNVELGLKYRYFNTGRLHFDESADFDDFGARAKFRSHSILASLIFNFGGTAAPLPPPPPPAPAPVDVAPATQTCPDGTVIMATEMCPLPPAPPPPPPPVPERG
ncbi:MAG TPA: outer membrane beta-barrel protein [Sphingomicrobium sp.]|nr:outer membrane beta-barrel protein [Sphingomicrobium sp.]